MGRIVGIQYLRAVAALLVVLVHTANFFHVNGHTVPIGRFGVDLFFVVSGFVMVATTRDMGSGQFMARRIIRVVPIYWLATLVGALYSFHGGFHVGFLVPFADFLRSLFFIPFENEGARGFVMPVVEVGWTLNLEMLFYLLFALSLWLPAALRIWAVGGALALLVVGAGTLGAGWPALAFYANSIVFEFVAGMAIAGYYLQGRLKPSRYLLPAVLVLTVPALVIWPDPTGIGALDYGIAASAILWATLAFENWFRKAPSRFWLALGDASYSLYLTHKIWLELLLALSFKGLFPKYWLLSWPIAFGGSVIIALISYRLIERPVTDWLNGWRARRRANV